MNATEHDQGPSQSENTEEDDTPALFMSEIPKNFDLNPSLKAIAALIDEDEESSNENNAAEHILKPRNSPIQNKPYQDRRAIRRKHISPYPEREKKPKRAEATSGELQVYMSLWNL
uniref:Uncharacterized protein n=1 Tax=Fibrocapsa japonica TaxID=94617 RepID=A0A7S2V9R7_9STRA|eukprot:CAMPEP_0113937860 /NCGR_PEP_ID=MMETSP1339-20121228/4372_1 /TAXON_ID=94617 /ORGANISM="Fibrocapsa japonica" /LENGTH=115 /DNA_ID=CAMNT_0000940767 /DNA_START=68 /DNA_END=415 /DNA_ORIENTATION=- /assembly_acc=CAM_ASM_000762